MPSTISFTLNDQPVSVETDPNRKLAWILRTELELTGTKFGCGKGQCRTCTVLVDDRPTRSCMLDIRAVRGKKVTTIEGLEKNNGELHPLQKAFMANDALQCGYCTPGMILTAYGLLAKNPHPSREDIIDEMDNNLCRCGAHPRIVDAIVAASQDMR